MATFLDVTLLTPFTTIFTFLFIFVIIYGMLEVFKVFGEGRRGIHAIIAISVAFVVILSKGVVAVVQTFTPWFFIVILLIFFILFAVRMFGVSTESITKGFHDNTAILIFILIFSGIILLFSLGAGFGQQSLEDGGQGTQGTQNTTVSTGTPSTVGQPGSTDTGDFNQNMYNTLYHPKVLGLILIMLVVVMAMLLLTSKGGD
jgi:hypothetical protein